jgi:hypothetical protein
MLCHAARIAFAAACETLQVLLAQGGGCWYTSQQALMVQQEDAADARGWQTGDAGLQARQDMSTCSLRYLTVAATATFWHSAECAGVTNMANCVQCPQPT